MKKTGNSFFQWGYGQKTTLAVIALGFLVWIFINANPWLIAFPIFAGLLLLLGYLGLQLRKPTSAKPQNVIFLEKELSTTQSESAQAEKQNPLASVLIVEDNAVSLKTLSKLFTALGAQSVTEAQSAEQALFLINTQQFTFILTDYRLGGMSGVQLLEQIRAGGNETPVIILSATPDQTAVLRTAAFERTDFFGKPLRKDDLSNAIERLTAPV